MVNELSSLLSRFAYLFVLACVSKFFIKNSLGNGVNLTGTIPHELSQLKQLKSLKLENNHLQGTLPSSLGQLSRLTYIVSEDGATSIMQFWVELIMFVSFLTKVVYLFLTRFISYRIFRLMTLKVQYQKTLA